VFDYGIVEFLLRGLKKYLLSAYLIMLNNFVIQNVKIKSRLGRT
jgi:hypothetical protein